MLRRLLSEGLGSPLLHGVVMAQCYAAPSRCYRRCENERKRRDGIDPPECWGIIHEVFVEVLDRLC